MAISIYTVVRKVGCEEYQSWQEENVLPIRECSMKPNSCCATHGQMSYFYFLNSLEGRRELR